jgi:hypothetical protein
MVLSEAMITVDCADPRSLAAWWAEALGVEIAQDFDGEHAVPGLSWTVLQDPEGNEFCVR